MVNEKIVIWGVWVYNLKNIDVMIFKNKLVVIMGLFGFGKFFLVFDILYVEG